jgi:TIR domain/VIT family
MSSLTDLRELVGFFSYSRMDDKGASGALSHLRSWIFYELRLQLGREYRLWQDTTAIPEGALWQGEIERTISESVFFIPIVTPSAVASAHCRREFEAFRAREEELGRADLIFPILYVTVSGLEDETLWMRDPVLKIIGERQYLDYRPFRHYRESTPEISAKIEQFCSNICRALQKPGLSPEERRAREAEERRRAEEALRAEEIRISEQKRIAAYRRAAEEQRLAEEKRSADEKREAEARRIAEQQARLTDERARRLAREQEERKRREEKATLRQANGPETAAPLRAAGLPSTALYSAITWCAGGLAAALVSFAVGELTGGSIAMMILAFAIFGPATVGALLWRSGMQPGRAAVSALSIIGLALGSFWLCYLSINSSLYVFMDFLLVLTPLIALMAPLMILDRRLRDPISALAPSVIWLASAGLLAFCDLTGIGMPVGPLPIILVVASGAGVFFFLGLRMRARQT